MDSKITIGVTGGIGSGKSIVCRIIHTMGYPVFYSDEQAKLILTENASVINKVKELFGEQAYLNTELNRSFIAEKIFSDNELIQKLNEVVHPAVRNSFENWTKTQDSKIVFNEAAILFETGSYKNFDYTILVTAPQNLRIKRVMTRDGATKAEVISRMQKQWPDEKKEKLASFIINNDENQLLIPQVLAILKSIKP